VAGTNSSLSDNTPPSGLSFVNGLVEELVEEQRLELGFIPEGLSNVLQKDGSNDATCSEFKPELEQKTKTYHRAT
jgi:hypothetical protein